MGIAVTIENGRPVGYLTSAEYAQKCGVADATIRVWMKRGKLKTVLKIGNDLWISEEEARPERKKKELTDIETKKEFEFFYFVEDVAIILDVDRETVRRWIRSGTLNAKMDSRRKGYRIMHDDLKKFAVTYSVKTRDLWNSKGFA